MLNRFKHFDNDELLKEYEDVSEHIKEIKNYRYNAFGIRFEFIDTESNRYIYIVTIS